MIITMMRQHHSPARLPIATRIIGNNNAYSTQLPPPVSLLLLPRKKNIRLTSINSSTTMVPTNVATNHRVSRFKHAPIVPDPLTQGSGADCRMYTTYEVIELTKIPAMEAYFATETKGL